MIDKIESIICAGEGFEPREIHNHCREFDIKLTRQMIMYFAKRETKLTLKVIAGYFNLNHATASHALKVMGNYIDTDPAFRAKIESYELEIRRFKRIYKKVDGVSLFYELQSEVVRMEKRVAELKITLVSLKDDIDKIDKISTLSEINT